MQEKCNKRTAECPLRTQNEAEARFHVAFCVSGDSALVRLTYRQLVRWTQLTPRVTWAPHETAEAKTKDGGKTDGVNNRQVRY